MLTGQSAILVRKDKHLPPVSDDEVFSRSLYGLLIFLSLLEHLVSTSVHLEPFVISKAPRTGLVCMDKIQRFVGSFPTSEGGVGTCS